MPESEKSIQARILLALGSKPDVRMFVNPCGQCWAGPLLSSTPTSATVGYPKRITYGLVPGSGDLIGWRAYQIRLEDVGKAVAIFASCEIKRPKGSVTSGTQMNWLTQVRLAGGIAIIARSDHEALSGVLGWRPG